MIVDLNEIKIVNNKKQIGIFFLQNPDLNKTNKQAVLLYIFCNYMIIIVLRIKNIFIFSVKRKEKKLYLCKLFQKRLFGKEFFNKPLFINHLKNVPSQA
jgi:hypothetical protein